MVTFKFSDRAAFDRFRSMTNTAGRATAVGTDDSGMNVVCVLDIDEDSLLSGECILQSTNSCTDFIQFKDGNLFPEPITSDEALNILKQFFLGESWYVVDPLSKGQINVHIVDSILRKFPRKYRKFCKARGWRYS